MKNSRVCIFSVIFVLFCLNVNTFGQKRGKKESSSQGYEIKFIFEGLRDTLLYFARTHVDQTFIYDTLFLSKKEPFTYISKKDTILPRGFYVLGNQDKAKLMDIVIDSSHSFVVKATNLNPSAPDIMNNVIFINSPENEAMNNFFLTMSKFQRQMITLNNEIKREEAEEEPDAELIESKRQERRVLQGDMMEYRLNFLEANKHTLFGKAQHFTRDIEIPEPPRNPDGSLVDSHFAYNYYLNHYWDHMDFTDPAMLSIPQNVFYDKLKAYFDDVVPPLVDSIIKYADILIEKSKNTPELFRYFVWYITNKYERSQYVAHDAVFVHMVQKYYARGLCPWTDEAVLERMVTHANKLSHILIGKKAPELIMADTNDLFYSNYGINKKYTVMWFWDLKCGHCKTAAPKLVEFYNRAKDSLDFEIYAICMTTDIEGWKQAIIDREFTWINVGGNRANLDYRVVYDVTTTPVIFVLDKDKNIIVKRIGIDELENFIRNYDDGKIKY